MLLKLRDHHDVLKKKMMSLLMMKIFVKNFLLLEENCPYIEAGVDVSQAVYRACLYLIRCRLRNASKCIPDLIFGVVYRVVGFHTCHQVSGEPYGQHICTPVLSIDQDQYNGAKGEIL